MCGFTRFVLTKCARVSRSFRLDNMPPKKRVKHDKNQTLLTSLLSSFPHTNSATACSSAESADQPPIAHRDSVDDNPSAESPFDEPCEDPEPEKSAVADSAADKSKKSSASRVFKPLWKHQFPWMTYDEEQNVMFCSLCVAAGIARNSFTLGCSNFRTSALKDHMQTTDHRHALEVPKQQQNKAACEGIMLTKQEKGMMTAVRAVNWLIKEDQPLAKFPSIMALLKESGAANMEVLDVSGGVHYNTRRTADEVLECLSECVAEEAKSALSASPFVSVMADETTDITVKKRLGVYVRTVDPETMEPKTRFLANVSITDGTGKSMDDAINTLLNENGLPANKIIALGSDGAAAMTGPAKGLTGMMRRRSPHMINIHCIAHRLALCTSQAAEGVPTMKDYQETLTSLFLYFKGSPVRSAALECIQELLDESVLRFKEVYSVRWLSFYKALETVYRTLEPLLTYLCDSNRRQDAKASGLRKKVR